MFDAQIKPLQQSRANALEDMADLLSETNIAQFITTTARHRLLSSKGEFYDDLFRANDNSKPEWINETKFELCNEGELKCWYHHVNNAQGQLLKITSLLMSGYNKILQEMGIDKNHIRTIYQEQEEEKARLWVHISITLDERDIQTMINREADRRLNELPEVQRAKQHLQGFAEAAKQLGGEEMEGGKFSMLRKVAAGKYEEIAERVYAELLGKARFKKPFDEGGAGDDREPDTSPSVPGGRRVPSGTGSGRG